MKDPAQTAAKWAARLGGATQEIAAGVAAVNEAPGAKAARNSAGWLAKTQAAQQKFEQNVGRVSLSEWQNAMVTKGIPRVAQGAQQAVPKMEGFLREFLPHVESGAQRVRQMPKVTFEDSMARMRAMAEHNHRFRRGGGTGQPFGR